LKYLEILLTSLDDFARIRGDNLSMLTSLSGLLLFLPFEVFEVLIFGINLAATLFLKEPPLLSAISVSQPHYKRLK